MGFHFGLTSSIDPVKGTVAVLLVIAFVFAFEFFTNLLEHSIRDSPLYNRMVQQIYKELMQMGIISFIIIMYEATVTKQTLTTSEWIVAIDFAHILLFFVAIYYVCYAVLFIIQSLFYSVKCSRMHLENTARLIKSMRVMRWWNQGIFKYFQFTSLRKKVEYKIIEQLFRSTYVRMPEDFNIAWYLQKCFKQYVLKTIDIGLYSWLAVAVLAIGNFGRLQFDECLSGNDDHIFDPSNSTNSTNATVTGHGVAVVSLLVESSVRVLSVSAESDESMEGLSHEAAECMRADIIRFLWALAGVVGYIVVVAMFARLYEIRLINRVGVSGCDEYLDFLQFAMEEEIKDNRLNAHDSSRMTATELKQLIVEVIDHDDDALVTHHHHHFNEKVLALLGRGYNLLNEANSYVFVFIKRLFFSLKETFDSESERPRSRFRFSDSGKDNHHFQSMKRGFASEKLRHVKREEKLERRKSVSNSIRGKFSTDEVSVHSVYSSHARSRAGSVGSETASQIPGRRNSYGTGANSPMTGENGSFYVATARDSEGPSVKATAVSMKSSNSGTVENCPVPGNSSNHISSSNNNHSYHSSNNSGHETSVGTMDMKELQPIAEIAGDADSENGGPSSHRSNYALKDFEEVSSVKSGESNKLLLNNGVVKAMDAVNDKWLHQRDAVQHIEAPVKGRVRMCLDSGSSDSFGDGPPGALCPSEAVTVAMTADEVNRHAPNTNENGSSHSRVDFHHAMKQPSTTVLSHSSSSVLEEHRSGNPKQIWGEPARSDFPAELVEGISRKSSCSTPRNADNFAADLEQIIVPELHVELIRSVSKRNMWKQHSKSGKYFARDKSLPKVLDSNKTSDQAASDRIDEEDESELSPREAPMSIVSRYLKRRAEAEGSGGKKARSSLWHTSLFRWPRFSSIKPEVDDPARKNYELSEDISDIFMFQEPSYFFKAFEIGVMFNCLYLSMWSTNFITFIEQSSQFAAAAHVLMVLPFIVTMPLVAYIAQVCCLIFAFADLQLPLLRQVLEEQEAENELLNDFRSSLLSRLVKRTGDKYMIVMELFNSIDVHLSGYLGRVEFKLLLSKLRLHYSDDRFRRLFRAIDKNFDGKIDASELEWAIFQRNDHSNDEEMSGYQTV